jgi:hypothetical protein
MNFKDKERDQSNQKSYNKQYIEKDIKDVKYYINDSKLNKNEKWR